MLVRTEDAELHHVEFQSTNEAGFAWRMLAYLTYFRQVYAQRIHQLVLYTGKEGMRLQSSIEEPRLSYSFPILNLREMEAAPLLQSDNWVDNLLALAAKGNVREALGVVLGKIRDMAEADRHFALGALATFARIIEVDSLLKATLESKEFAMIDVNLEESPIIGPLIQRGREQGRQEGRQEGLRQALVTQLEEKFGAVPDSARELLKKASDADLKRWTIRILQSHSVEDTLR